MDSGLDVGDVAVPDNATVLVPAVALLITASVPLNVPAVVGLNSTLMCVVSPGFRPSGIGGSEEIVNGVVTVMPLRVRLALPLLVTVTD